MIVTLGHLRRAPGFGVRPGFCAQGGREWFAYYGLDWSAFVRDGIDAEALEATDDALGLHLVAFARAGGATLDLLERKFGKAAVVYPAAAFAQLQEWAPG